MKAGSRLLLIFLIVQNSWCALTVDLITRAFDKSSPSGRNSSSPELSTDGRWLAFVSDSELLTTNVTKSGVLNIFLRDNQNGSLMLVSIGTNGLPADGNSYAPQFSKDGTKLLFSSEAANLLMVNSHEHSGLYLYDLALRQTVALLPGDILTYSITPDAQNVLYETPLALSELDTNTVNDLYLYNVRTGTNELVSLNFSNTAAIGAERTDNSFEASISDDGRYIAYVSGSLGVVPNLPLTPQPNLYIRDMLLKTNLLVTKDASGPVVRGYGSHLEGAVQSGISSDGRWLFFKSESFLTANPASYNNNYVYSYDVISRSLTRLRAEYPKAAIDHLTLSSDSKYLAFAQGDRLYIKNLTTDQNRLITSADGLVTNVFPAEVMFSSNGRFLIFQGAAPLTSASSTDFQYYGFDQETGRVRLIGASAEGNVPNEPVLSISVSDDGWVSFETFASNLGVDGDSRGSDVFLQKLLDDQAPIICVSGPPVGIKSVSIEGRAWLEPNALSADGRYIVFTSEDATLVQNDTNSTRDLFRYDGLNKTNQLLTFTLDGQQRTNSSRLIGSSSDATSVAYFSREPGERSDSIFVYNTLMGRTTRESLLPSGDVAPVGTTAALSADGRFLAFSVANQFFIRDLAKGRTAPTMPVNLNETILLSPVGTYLVRIILGSQIAVVDWNAGRTWYRQFDLFPVSSQISFSGDESRMTFFGRTRDSVVDGDDLYIFDSIHQTLTLAATNAVPPAALSWNGEILLFQTYEQGAANRSVRIKMRNLMSGETTTLPLDYTIPFRLRGQSLMSDDSRFVLLSAPAVAAPLSPDLHEWHLYDAALATLTPLIQRVPGSVLTAPSGLALLSADGSAVAFTTMSSDLVPLDLNLRPDIFLAQISLADVNQNGIEDGWERLHPLASDPDSDLDGDGMSNRAEYHAGTDPANPNSNLHMVVIENQETGLSVEWNSVRGRHYLVQTAIDPAANTWEPLGGPLMATSSKSQTPIPGPAEARRFYRILLSH